MAGDALAHARAALRAAGLRGERIAPIGFGVNTLLDVDDRFIVRLGTSADGLCFPKSAAILRRLEGRVRAPEVVHADFTCAAVPWPYIVLRKIPGRLPAAVWRDLPAARREAVAADLCRQLRGLHAETGEGVPGLDEPYWVGWLRDAGANLAAARAVGAVSPDKLTRIGDFIERHADGLRAAGPLRVAHCDLHPNNLLVVDGDGIALLDFDDAVLGVPLLDLFWFVDPKQTQKWEELHQEPRQLLGWIARHDPELLSTPDAVTHLQLLALLEATHGLAPTATAPVGDLPEANLRCDAVFGGHFEALLGGLAP